VDFTKEDNKGVRLEKLRREVRKIYYAAYDRDGTVIGKVTIWGKRANWLNLVGFWDEPELYIKILGG